jgi:hypothetical protein
MRGIRAGAVAGVVGLLLIFVGLFSLLGRCAVPGAPCPSPSPNEIAAYLGLALLVLGVILLLRAGWHGRAAGWVLAAVAIVPVTWFTYELARQGICPMLSDPAVAQACLEAYGEMTAPMLSYGAAGLVLLVGLLRWRRLRAARPSSGG